MKSRLIKTTLGLAWLVEVVVLARLYLTPKVTLLNTNVGCLNAPCIGGETVVYSPWLKVLLVLGILTLVALAASLWRSRRS